MGRLAVKKIPPDVAKDVRSIDQGAKDLEHPYYQVEQRKGTGKATCRQCDKPIKEGESTLYFHYAPDDDNEWIRTRGSIHAEDCSDGQNTWTKCPAPGCMKQIPRSEWSDHWKKERAKRTAHEDSDLPVSPLRRDDWVLCPNCKGAGCGGCKQSGLTPGFLNHLNEEHLWSDEAYSAWGGDIHDAEAVTDLHEREHRDHAAGNLGNNLTHDMLQHRHASGKSAQVVNPLKGIQKQRNQSDTGMGLDPTSTPGNQTSMGERNVGDGAQEGQESTITNPDPVQNMMKGDLDQAAKKLQRGIKGLDAFAGSWKLTFSDKDYYRECERCSGTGQIMLYPYKCFDCKGTGVLGEYDENSDPLGNPVMRINPRKTGKTKEQRDWWTPIETNYQTKMKGYHEELANRSEYEICRMCGGTGKHDYVVYQEPGGRCGGCDGSGLGRTMGPPPKPERDESPIKPCPCTSCTDNVRANAKWDNWGRVIKGRIPSIQRWMGLDKNGPHAEVYPNRRFTCPSCSGSGKPSRWQRDEDKTCYSCKGSGEGVEEDPRNLFEHALSKFNGAKHMVGLAGSTGVWEDADHYHVRLHSTDILDYHKTKPEVSINWGSGNQWATNTTRDRTDDYLPRDINVGYEKVRPGKSSATTHDLVVRTPTAAYMMNPGITINTETGKAVGDAQEIHRCSRCRDLREDADDMAKHERLHDSYERRYQENPKRKCLDCNGTGTTEAWQTQCKGCKGRSTLTNGQACGQCQGTGITYHRGAQPKIEYQNNKTQVVDPDKCGTCRGEGQVDKRRPA